LYNKAASDGGLLLLRMHLSRLRDGDSPPMRYFQTAMARQGIPPELRRKWFGTVAAVVFALTLLLGGLIYFAAHGSSAGGSRWVPDNARTSQRPAR
jgi:hypothetical protein